MEKKKSQGTSFISHCCMFFVAHNRFWLYSPLSTWSLPGVGLINDRSLTDTSSVSQRVESAWCPQPGSHLSRRCYAKRLLQRGSFWVGSEVLGFFKYTFWCRYLSVCRMLIVADLFFWEVSSLLEFLCSAHIEVSLSWQLLHIKEVLAEFIRDVSG